MVYKGTKAFGTHVSTPGLLNVIPSCPWYYDCGDPMYVGECRKECWDRYLERKSDSDV